MTISHADNLLRSFHWAPQPEAERFVTSLADRFLARSPFARELRGRLHDEAGVRFIDLIDALHVGPGDASAEQLQRAGFVRSPVEGAEDRYVQEQGIFPAVVIRPGATMRVDLKVEFVADFLACWQIQGTIEGAPLGPLRRARVEQSDGAELWVVERHGWRRFDVPEFEAHDAVAVLNHAEAFRRRRRFFDDDAGGFSHAAHLIDGAVGDLGVDRACDLFFAVEREFWQRRNRAARVQKARQDALGIGWANHDHHTYRSSRENFARLIGIFEKLGCVCRERFYAGAQAGWGAQVLEQPNAGIVIFADVDLSPDELFQDFAHEGLTPLHNLGTVGLWCALHGDAFLEAGMHHLECQFDFDALTRQLGEREGVKLMKPFTDFSYLRQAFTEGEIWPVRPERIDRLQSAGRITADQANRFREHGALGSHLENLERNEGFKGFNQTGVSEIIARTDPRARSAQH